mmetsp:Transcript_36224/g.91165  ORF Transcript_36224/g.91165 Transcript_36224/m.91165 type:complete len:405 (-) Transcript_36224:66-1280(-)
MIYICTAPCEGCNRACGKLGKCCSKLERICGSCSWFFCSWFDRPLGGLILIATTMTVSAAVVAGVSLGDEKVRRGSACDDYWLEPLWFCCVDVALAVVHISFLVYFQQRLLFRLQGEALEEESPQQVAGAKKQQPPERMPQELLQRAFTIIAYDFGFCVYVFVFLFSLMANIFGLVSSLECLHDADDTLLPRVAAVLYIAFAIVAVCFLVLWLFALSVSDDDCCCCCCFAQPAGQQDTRRQLRLPQLSHSLSRIVAGRPQSYALQPNIPCGTRGTQSCPLPPLPMQVNGVPVYPVAVAPTPQAQRQEYAWPAHGPPEMMMPTPYSLGMRQGSPHPSKAEMQKAQWQDDEDEGCCPCLFPGVGSSGTQPRQQPGQLQMQPHQPQMHWSQQQHQAPHLYYQQQVVL